MLVNTGSALAIAREHFWVEAIDSVEQHLQACTDSIVAANEEVVLIWGKISVTLQVRVIQEEYPVYIASDVTPDCLLGADFRNHFGCIVDLGKILVAGGMFIEINQTFPFLMSCVILGNHGNPKIKQTTSI